MKTVLDEEFVKFMAGQLGWGEKRYPEIRDAVMPAM